MCHRDRGRSRWFPYRGRECGIVGVAGLGLGGLGDGDAAAEGIVDDAHVGSAVAVVGEREQSFVVLISGGDAACPRAGLERAAGGGGVVGSLVCSVALGGEEAALRVVDSPWMDLGYWPEVAPA